MKSGIRGDEGRREHEREEIHRPNSSYPKQTDL